MYSLLPLVKKHSVLAHLSYRERYRQAEANNKKDILLSLHKKRKRKDSGQSKHMSCVYVESLILSLSALWTCYHLNTALWQIHVQTCYNHILSQSPAVTCMYSNILIYLYTNILLPIPHISYDEIKPCDIYTWTIMTLIILFNHYPIYCCYYDT